jgi:hypothetical protein
VLIHPRVDRGIPHHSAIEPQYFCFHRCFSVFAFENCGRAAITRSPGS